MNAKRSETVRELKARIRVLAGPEADRSTVQAAMGMVDKIASRPLDKFRRRWYPR